MSAWLSRFSARLRPSPAAGIFFHPRRCLRNRFHGSGCERCRRECPAGALTLAASGVTIDSGKCVGCLACVAVCPSLALEIRDRRLATLISRLLPKAGQPLTLCCEKSIRTGREIVLPCLGALSQEELAACAALADGLTLQLVACRACLASAVAEILRTRLEQLQFRLGPAADLLLIRLLVAVPCDRLRLLDRDEPSLSGDGPVSQGQSEPIPSAAAISDSAAGESSVSAPGSRRAFFRAFRQVSFHAAGETWSALREEEAADGRALPSEKSAIPRSLALQQALSKAGAERQGLLIPLFFHLEVGPECNFCWACVGMCPTGALKNEWREGAKKLQFKWAACSGCGLCREFCRKKAITISPAPALPAEELVVLLTSEPPS